MAFSFGTPAATTSQGLTFGSTAKPAFSFGTNTSFNTSSFGTGNTTTSTAQTGFGAGGFGAKGFGTGGSLFGTATTSSQPTFGIGAPTFGSTAPNFGSAAPAFGTTAPSFGTASTFGSAAPTFGTSAPTFGTSFGTGGGGFSFGKPTTAAPSFGLQAQQQQQQNQQGVVSPHEALVTAVFNCVIFGDERDQVLAKWNLLQAQWGTGTAYYSRGAQPLTLTEQNPLCRFKAVGYSRMAVHEDHEGLVALTFTKPLNEIKAAQQSLVTSINNVIGNRTNLVVTIHALEPLGEDKTQVVLFITDTNTNNKINATDLANELSKDNIRAALTHIACRALVKPSPSVLQNYLDVPPPGMDARLWKQAQIDNPDSGRYVPVPVVGFAELERRAKCQMEQISLQGGYIRRAREQLSELERRRVECTAKGSRLATRLHELRHILLTVVARSAASRPDPLSNTEENVRARIAMLYSSLNSPPLYIGRLNELLSAVRLQRGSIGGSQERYQLDSGAAEELKSFLLLQQKGIKHLMSTVQSNLDSINTMSLRIHELRS